MSEPLFVKPAAGAILPNPDRMFAPLAADGELVPDTAFWRRRIIAGDVTREAVPAETPVPEAQAAE
ncbi:MAG: hypothetical protein JWM36_3246 [Hyphomicrobiales bacterium]|nr:hypothetical protein [Hyphomicrobiales bacterium]